VFHKGCVVISYNCKDGNHTVDAWNQQFYADHEKAIFFSSAAEKSVTQRDIP
jgi:hypothetical protein